MLIGRPSHKEIFNKLKKSREVIGRGQILLIKETSIEADALELDYLLAELPEVLLKLLDEVTPHDYIGARPPSHSYETQIKGADLFEFKFFSDLFNCDVYLKFTIKNEIFWLVSLHKDKALK